MLKIDYYGPHIRIRYVIYRSDYLRTSHFNLNKPFQNSFLTSFRCSNL